MSKVAILTAFAEFPPGYSLTGIVKDQVRMLTEHGHEVSLFVAEHFKKEDEAAFGPEVRIVKRIPFTHQKDYKTKKDLTPEHREIAERTAAVLVEELQDTPIVFTHDFVFTGWFYPFGLGCQIASPQLPNTRWLHWIHSVPSVRSDWWEIKDYGSHHKLVYPNRIDAIKVAEQYRGFPDDVRVIPHIKDMRSWFDYDDETCKFIREFPAVMQAHVVQIYPSSVDRLKAKRLKEVIKIFAHLKRRGLSVCLVVANQWATGKQQKEDILKYKKIAAEEDLIVGQEVIFSSDWQNGKYDVGLPKRIVRELFQLSNLFIFPTREETFGLVLPEASLAGGVLCVLNKSLKMMLEVSGFTSIYFDFGSFDQEHHIENEDAYFKDIAWLIAARLKHNESILTKTHMRRTFNYDALYNKVYGPIMAESQIW